MELQLSDKIVIVTGGAKGIGAGICRELAKEGAVPIIVGRNREDNLALVKELQNEGLAAAEVTAELSSPQQCEEAVFSVIEKFGRIDGLVNNAGVNDSVGLEHGSYDAFINSLHSNLIHYYLMAHHALPELKKSRGSIVNIGSKIAETGQGGSSAYAAANGGRSALTREWAVELLPYHIRVNAVIVAESYTPLYKQWIESMPEPQKALDDIKAKIPFGKRMTTVEEIAAMVVFLLSTRSSHTTGQLIHVDGGYVHLDRRIS